MGTVRFTELPKIDTHAYAERNLLSGRLNCSTVAGTLAPRAADPAHFLVRRFDGIDLIVTYFHRLY